MERFVCPKCKGERRAKTTDTITIQRKDGTLMERTYPTTKKCWVCNGTGEVDWLTNITQREDNTVPF
jgi:hypothetical protein